MMKLVIPSIEYKESYLEALQGFVKEGYCPEGEAERYKSDFQGAVEEELNRSNPDKMTEVQRGILISVFWLVEGDQFLGRVSIKHTLNDFLFKYAGNIGYIINPFRRKQGHGKLILELALEKAKELGLGKALLTCDSDNIGSKKIIEANGGVFENEVHMEGNPALKRRYWIEL